MKNNLIYNHSLSENVIFDYRKEKLTFIVLTALVL